MIIPVEAREAGVRTGPERVVGDVCFGRDDSPDADLRALNARTGGEDGDPGRLVPGFVATGRLGVINGTNVNSSPRGIARRPRS